MSLPNGFHDAWLRQIEIDYFAGEIRLLLDVWIGCLSVKDHNTRETRRACQLTISDIKFFAIEPASLGEINHPQRIDIGTLETLRSPPRIKLPDVSDGVSIYWIFLSQTNSFVYIAATSASIRSEGVVKQTGSGPDTGH